jgi:hypothetical protein
VPVEQQLLPSAALKPVYDKLAWLYVNRNFDNSSLDRVAERIELRFGVSSYPHLLLVDPETLEVIREVGRTEKAFLDAVGRAKVDRPADPKAAAEKLKQAEERLAKLAKSPTVTAARKALDDEDVVVRYAALQVLAKQQPRAVAAKAGELLAVPHDQLRYEVCEVLARVGDRSAASALEALVRDPKGSMNPNVLRIRAVQALAACGRAESVPAVAEFATTGQANNTLTHEAVETLAAIAIRVPKAKAEVKAALVQSYPPPGPGNLTAKLAQAVHQLLTRLTGKRVPFPPRYDDAARAKLIKSW